MPGIDQSLIFHPLNIAVLTVSDTRTIETDTSGALLAERLSSSVCLPRQPMPLMAASSTSMTGAESVKAR